MRLDPVYLVEPRPGHPTMSTRRAFLLAGSTFAIGTSLGGACGFAAGVASTEAEHTPNDRKPQSFDPSDNLTLDELRRLAVEAPIAELMGRWQVFLGLLSDTYPNDQVLWVGAERIGRYVVENERLPSRLTLAKWLEQIIANSRTAPAQSLGELAAQLRSVR